MNRTITSVLCLCGLAWVPAQAGPTLTPAEISIQKAEAQIAKRLDYAPYYDALAMAYARRARETSDVSFYEKADATVKRALEITPDDFEARKVKTWILLGRHEFGKALEEATALNKKMPDDVTVYGFLADANVELGNYKAAVDAVQWMLNIKAGNVPGLTRAAYLREIHGDVTGALDLMQTAYDATAFSETEDRAWILTQMAHLHWVAGDLAKAEVYGKGALEVFPGYHYALAAMAKIRTAQKRYEEAARLLEQRYKAAPHAENLYSLAEALQAVGREDEAATAFAEFERKSLAESDTSDNSNHELIAYYLDVAKDPAKALEIATKEIARRRDKITVGLYTRALAEK